MLAESIFVDNLILGRVGVKPTIGVPFVWFTSPMNRVLSLGTTQSFETES